MTLRIETDLDKIEQNTRILVDRLAATGIRVTGITKAVLGSPGVGERDALAQVTQLDHEHDGVRPLLLGGCLIERREHHGLGVQADVGDLDDPCHLAEHGGADQRA